MKYAIGCDHSAVDYKNQIISFLKNKNIEVLDFGTEHNKPADYPDIGLAVAEAVANHQADYGIVICGTGIGISISANKVPGIRCALCTTSFHAKMAKQHNDANVLALGARVTGIELAIDIVDTFISTTYTNEDRHIRRIGKITAIDDKYRK